jgi:hypothetical protein
MTDTKRTRLVRKKKVPTFGGRGQIYSWLRTHHAEIEGLRAVHLNLWAALAVDMVEDGITAAAANRGLRDRIWKSWQRVCRDVAAEAARPKRVPPSRISPDWRPTVVPPPPIRAAPAVAGTTPSPPSNDPRAPSRDPDMTPEGQAMLDRIWADLLADDRKKFGHQG